MKSIKHITFALLATAALAGCGSQPQTTPEALLKEAFQEKFLVGTALNVNHLAGSDDRAAQLTQKQFNSVVAENCMKSEELQPEEGKFMFEAADQFVNFGVENKMFVVGHCLVWHSQAPKWFFVDQEGKEVSREVLIERMRTHIFTVVEHFKGRVQGWDVVNEALNDDGTLRNSKFLQIIGEEYIELAFRFAQEADPNVALYYNDYSMFKPEKVAGAIKIVQNLQTKGIRIDAVGMQCHYMLEGPAASEVEQSIVALAQTGCQVMITELDLSVLPFPRDFRGGANISDMAQYEESLNPYTKGVPSDVEAAWEALYTDYFKVFLKHSDKIHRVTFWGVGDGDSWKNDWPIKGRTDYPLFFDRDYKAKPIVAKVATLVVE